MLAIMAEWVEKPIYSAALWEDIAVLSALREQQPGVFHLLRYHGYLGSQRAIELLHGAVKKRQAGNNFKLETDRIR
jgi:hypothetical protein